MATTRINSYSTLATGYIPLDSPGEAGLKKAPPLYIKDTIASASCLGSRTETVTAADLRPQLEQPAKALKQAEIEQRQTYTNCVKAQQALMKKDSKISNNAINQTRQENKKIQEEIADQTKDMIRRAKTSKILKWVNRVFTGVATAAGIASIAIILTTGIAALPTLLAIIGASATVIAGGATIAKGILDHKNNKIMGELGEKKSTRHLNTQKIKSAWEEMRHSVEVVFDLWRQLVQVMKNWLAAALNK